MKKPTGSICISVLSFMLLLSFQNANAQLWKKIKNEVKSRAENNVVNRAGNATDKAINNTADATKGNKPVADNSGSQNTSDVKDPASGNNVKKATVTSYKNYDF